MSPTDAYRITLAGLRRGKKNTTNKHLSRGQEKSRPHATEKALSLIKNRPFTRVNN